MKDNYVSGFQVAQEQFKKRTCENCKHFNLEVGTQPDGIGWERVECKLGNVNQCMDFDYTKVLCQEWEAI